jgi:hypothetical protein
MAENDDKELPEQPEEYEGPPSGFDARLYAITDALRGRDRTMLSAVVGARALSQLSMTAIESR